MIEKHSSNSRFQILNLPTIVLFCVYVILESYLTSLISGSKKEGCRWNKNFECFLKSNNTLWAYLELHFHLRMKCFDKFTLGP